MNIFQRFLISVSEDPVKYAMRVLIVLALGLFLALVVRNAHAKPTHIAQDGPVTVTIHDDKCALSAVVMPYRATWKEGDKTYEGCVGAHPAGLLIFYFSDKSIVLLAPQAFQRVSGI